MESPSPEELERLLAWVPFLEPLSEDERGRLALRLTFATLGAGETFVVGPEEHAQRMVLLLRGQLQVYEKDPSGRELRFCLRTASSTTGLCHWDCAVLVCPHPRELPHPSTGKLSPCSSQRRSMLS